MAILKAVWHIIRSVVDFVWQIALFLWVGLHTFGDWCDSVLHGVLLKTSFSEKLVLFVGWFLFAPFPWWTGLFFLFIPVIVSIPILVLCFVFFFIFSLAESVVFI